MPPGGPYKLTPERQATICRWMSTGSTVLDAAAAAGINRETIRGWMHRGGEQRARHKRGKYRSFLEAVEQARAQHKGTLVACVKKAGLTQWQAAAWLLERNWPEDFARTERHELTGKDGGPVATRAEVVVLPALESNGDATGGLAAESGAPDGLPPLDR